ncbi:1-phosphofructokinase [Mycoplasma leonicaptivi]|uniref:1-phosphofructokinase n=1 Tax=Mycoplasma leonicaptivi TaxID=36742 RepID=UPI000488C534|nr:1-phosphofructokinase family hexose kinase [Mycoplasma leonicaptivi]
MIYTLTLSPAIDFLIKSDDFELNKVNRYQNYEILPGGKGINASIVLSRHGFKNKAITLFDKNTFQQFNSLFENEKQSLINIDVKVRTRTNIKYYGSKTNFELNGPKTALNQEEKEKLFNILKTFQKDDILMLMGVSDENLLKQILEILKDKKIKIIFDVDTPNYLDFIKYQPYIVKPNLDELNSIFNKNFESDYEIFQAAKLLQEKGANNILISNGAKGSYLLDENNNFYKSAIKNKINVVSATGAGDTMISIFTSNYLLNKNSKQALINASAASMGTVSVSWLTDKKISDKFLSNVEISELKF